jgi:hypothetical protein
VEEPLVDVSGESCFSVKIFGDGIFSSEMKVYGIIRHRMFIPDRITLYKHQREYKWELDRRIPQDATEEGFPPLRNPEKISA